jgi:hypothetical protein
VAIAVDSARPPDLAFLSREMNQHAASGPHRLLILAALFRTWPRIGFESIFAVRGRHDRGQSTPRRGGRPLREKLDGTFGWFYSVLSLSAPASTSTFHR